LQWSNPDLSCLNGAIQQTPGSAGAKPKQSTYFDTMKTTQLAKSPSAEALGLVSQPASTPAWQTVLVPIDFTPASRDALRFAVREARDHGARLILLHVVEPPSFMSGTEDSPLFKSNEQVVSECRLRLETWSDAEGASELPCERHVRIGKAHREILATAAEQQADVILMAEQPKNWLERFILGSVTRKVQRRASCCVLTISNASEQGTRSGAVKFAPETAWRSRVSDVIKPRARATAA
jgi:nucleotide-binding universal stress UspA family protein